MRDLDSKRLHQFNFYLECILILIYIELALRETDFLLNEGLAVVLFQLGKTRLLVLPLFFRVLASFLQLQTLFHCMDVLVDKLKQIAMGGLRNC